jgi:MarR family transcriptional regulator for hemolysin
MQLFTKLTIFVLSINMAVIKSKNNAPLSFFMNSLTKRYVGALRKMLPDQDLDRYYYTLLIINETPQPVTQQFIADFLKIDKTSMVRVIDYMSDKGFVKRKACPEDRRKHSLVLTEKAKKALPEITKALEELNSQCFKGCSEKEKQEFFSMLEKMSNNLEELPQEDVLVDYIKLKKKRSV